MGLIPEDVLEKIRTSADIATIIGERLPLKRAGRLLKGLCPFHNEKTPSFMVNPERQIYHCFGCGEGGNVFSFLMKFEGLDFVQAVERLAERYGITIVRTAGNADQAARQREEKQLFYEINRFAARFFYDQLTQSEAGRRGREYLERRGFRPEMIREGLLGFAPGGKALTRFLEEKKVPMAAAEKLGLVRRGEAGDLYDFFRERLLFAILNAEGKVLGFTGRALDPGVEPKYLNSPDSPIYAKGESLLGLRKGRGAIRENDQVIVVEGNFDQLRLVQEGIVQTVAPLGTALTSRQVQLLARWTRNFVLIFDGDSAGLRAADRALEIFLPLGIFPRAVSLPPGEDPDSYGLKLGGEALRREISVAGFLLDSFIDRVLREGGETPEGKGKAVRRIAQVLALGSGEVEKRLYIQKVAERIGLSEEVVAREVSRKGTTSPRASNLLTPRGEDKGDPLPALERTLLEILLSGRISPELLFQEISGGEAIAGGAFKNREASVIWEGLKEEFSRTGKVAADRVYDKLPEGRARLLLTELGVAAERWGGEGTDLGQVVTDLVRQIRLGKMKVRLKGLTQEIREAERTQQTGLLQKLLEHKSQILKQMRTVH